MNASISISKSILALAFLFFITADSRSQTRSEAGYIIGTTGDTIACKVHFKDWRINPTSVWVTVNNELKTFTTSDIRGFGIDDFADYKTASVTYHLNAIGGNNIPESYSNELTTKTFFVKVLVANVYSLYELVTPERAYFFISQNNGPMEELVYRVKKDESRVNEDLKYKQTLMTLFATEGISAQYESAINNIGYKRSDIISLINVLNEKHTGIKLSKTKRKKKNSGFEAGIFIGAIHNRLPTAFQGHYSEMSFTGETSPTAGVNVLYSLPGHFRSTAVGLSLGINKYSRQTSHSDSIHYYSSPAYYYNTGYSENASVTNSLLMANIYGMYFLNPRSAFRLYVKGGLNCNFTLNENSDIQFSHSATTSGMRNGLPSGPSYAEGKSEPLQMIRMIYGLNAGLGISKGRHKIELDYYSPVSLGMKKKYSLQMIGAVYYFSVFK